MARKLLESLPPDTVVASVLELGCGTGHLTRLLVERFPQATVVATDLSDAMLREAQATWPPELPSPSWEPLDAKAPYRAALQPELVASNALVQWFPDLATHFKAIRTLSKAGTEYLVSGFCRDHFPELETILGSTEFGYPPGPGHSPDEAIEAAQRSGWKALVLHEESRPETYGSATDFLRHLKASGANRPPPANRPLTRSRLQLLMDRLTREAGTPQGVRITWKPWFLRLEAA
jgi:SAM-dependent methyltransferase